MANRPILLCQQLLLQLCTVAVYVEITRLLLFTPLLGLFFFRSCLILFSPFIRVSVSILQYRSCLASFRCPAVSACLFCRVP